MTGDIPPFHSGRPASEMSSEDPGAWRGYVRPSAGQGAKGLSLPPTEGSLGSVIGRGQTLSVEGTNVVRVPFGIRQPRRARPARPEHWATLVLPFQPGSSPTPPPRAA